MSQAEELLDSLIKEQTNARTTNPKTEEHIIIGEDRFISVPHALQRIAVQYDHNVETVTFDCPRYWDEHDLTTMDIYINYMRADSVKSRWEVVNVVIDENDENLIHFEWEINSEATLANGKFTFLVCASRRNHEGIEEVHWNSELNSQMYISTGLEGIDSVYEDYPDIITDLLARMDYILVGDGTVLDKSLTLENFAAEAKSVGDRFNETNERIDSNDEDIRNINDEIGTINDTLNTTLETTIPDINNRINTNANNIITINELIEENDNRYEATYAKRENLGQLYLSSKYHDVVSVVEEPYDYTTPSLTSENPQGFTVTATGTPDFYLMDDIYTMVGGNGGGDISCGYKENDGFIIEFPSTFYFKLTSFYVKGSNLYLQIFGSNNGVNYTSIYNTDSGSGPETTGKHNVSNLTYYRYYKIVGQNWRNTLGSIYNSMVFYGKAIDISFDGNDLFITKKYSNEEIYDYEDGMIVKIKTPSTYINDPTRNSTLDIYGLGGRDLPTDLQPSTRYTLVYDGTKFIHDK